MSRASALDAVARPDTTSPQLARASSDVPVAASCLLSQDRTGDTTNTAVPHDGYPSGRAPYSDRGARSTTRRRGTDAVTIDWPRALASCGRGPDDRIRS